MSLILEALKKSEQQRRLGEAPTFGSPVVATRRRRSFLPVIAILIVVAAAVTWWLSRRAPQPPPATPAPVAANGAPAGAQPLSEQIQVRPPAAPLGNRAQDRTRTLSKADQEKRVAALGNATHATPPATSAAPGSGPIKPTATLVPPVAPAAPALDKSAGLRAPATTATAPPKVDASVPAATPPKTDASASSAPQKPDAAGTATAPNAQAGAKPAVSKPAAAGSALPTVWDLPYSVRKDLPALDLSMHVYSADPKLRFVVLKGDRHVEGDEVGQDLTLQEIRQDGIVLDYKGQRFFFPRTGR